MYFLYYTGFGIYLPFINIYYSHIGLSGLEIGLINTLSPLVGMLSAPLWGILNDRFGKTRVLLAIAVTRLNAGWLGHRRGGDLHGYRACRNPLQSLLQYHPANAG